MTIQDGYGEQFDYAEQAVIERERLLVLQARERAHHEGQIDDLIQEGRIALWKVAKAKPGAEAKYLNGVGAMRMRDVARGALLTGQEGRQGRERDPLRQQATSSLDAVLDAVGRDGEDFTPDALVDQAKAVEDIALAYHYGEILQVLAELPPFMREYIYMRFWQGMTQAEIAATTGWKSASLTDYWGKRIKPRLREELAHLAAAD